MEKVTKLAKSYLKNRRSETILLLSEKLLGRNKKILGNLTKVKIIEIYFKKDSRHVTFTSC